jgi:ADP-heptose:LPS heptosyltransferase
MGRGHGREKYLRAGIFGVDMHPPLARLPRDLFVGLLVRLFGSRQAPPNMEWRDRPFRVLFIRNDAIGDVLFSMEAMRAIAESSPQIVFDVLGSPANARILRTLPFVRDIILHERRFLLRAWPVWKRLRAARYDAVIDGRVQPAGVSLHTACLLLSTRAPWRIGIGGRRNDDVYTVKIDVPRLPYWTDYLVALGRPFGVAPNGRDWRPRIDIAAADREHVEREWNNDGRRPRILVNMSVRDPRRSWPPAKFAMLLARLRARLPEANIVLATMPAEHAAARSLVEPVGGRAVPLTLPQLFAAIATADMLISPETAVTHAAAAFQTPTLSLHMKDNERYRPYRTPGRAVAGDDPSRLTTLPTERAIAALDSLIDELAPARGWSLAGG